MNKFRKIVLAIGTMGLIAIAPMANAIPFSVTGASFTPEAGYGIDSSETSGANLLNVQFSTSGFLTVNFALNAVGDAVTFNFGTVNFLEPDTGGGIGTAETNDLGVTAVLTLTNPLGIAQNVVAISNAATGSVSDSAVDYTLVWTPVTVNFGTGGAFDIAMNSLSFTGTGLKTQTATITLRTLPIQATNGTVPEPSTLLLFGAGLAGLAWRFRRPS